MAVATTDAQASTTDAWTGDRVVDALQRGSLSLYGATIAGDIDFRRLDVVKHSFSCRNCAIEGRFLANDVNFDRTLDLRGAEFANAVLARRATFRAPVLFGSTSGGKGRPSSFGRDADFSFARFEDLAMFVGAICAKTGDFTTARFRSATIFADAAFDSKALFDRSIFSSGADFRGSEFDGQASFAAARFDSRADFSDVTFAQYADFEGARFGDDGTFLGALFTSRRKPYGVTFAGASSERDLIFDLAGFGGGGNFRQTVAGRTLSFDGAELATQTPLVFDRASAGGIAMDVDDALAVVDRGDRTRVLRLIEARSKANGDLGVANDARFSLEVLRSQDLPWHRRIPNVVFYRLVAGYFVRPLHPIATLVVLAALISLVRAVTGSFGANGFVHRAWFALRSFGREFVDALALIGRGGETKDRRGGRLEAWVYRALVVCALIGLGNSNPTLREMFDAIV